MVLFGLGQVEARFENRVTLDRFKRDDYGMPEIEVHFTRSEKDLAVIRQMAEDLEKVSYIADTSVMPAMGAANPVLSVVSLAIRTADYIIDRLR